MATGRQLLEALQAIDQKAPALLDQPLYATQGNDENGNCDIISVENILSATSLEVNGCQDLLGDDAIVALLESDGKDPLAMLEELLSITERINDFLMPEDYEVWQRIASETADLREGLNSL